MNNATRVSGKGWRTKRVTDGWRTGVRSFKHIKGGLVCADAMKTDTSADHRDTQHVSRRESGGSVAENSLMERFTPVGNESVRFSLNLIHKRRIK